MNRLILTVLLAFSVAIPRLAEGSMCNENPCKNGVCRLSMTGTYWDYSCECKPGYLGSQCQWDGKFCSLDTTTPCQNGGQCVDSFKGRYCRCPGDTNTTIRYGGHYCEIENPCWSCPQNTVFCVSALNVPSGRLCLDYRRVAIFGSWK